MRLFIFIFLFFTLSIYSQSAKTKFLLDGFLKERPSGRSKTLCEFKKRKDVDVIDFVGNNWWKVKYNSCIGFVVSPYLKMNKDLQRIEEDKWNQWEEEVKRDNDSIKRADSINKAEIQKMRIINAAKVKTKDSINKAEIQKMRIINAAKVKTKDSISKAEIQKIKKFIESTTSLTFNKNFIVTLKSNTKILVKPFSSAKTLLETNTLPDAYITGYAIDYYRVCVGEVCGYVRDNKIFKNDYVIKYTESIKNKIYLKKFGKVTYRKLKQGYYWLGMTSEMARISLGRPNDINRTVGSWGVHEQWVYNNGIYLYFEGGILKSYQN